MIRLLAGLVLLALLGVSAAIAITVVAAIGYIVLWVVAIVVAIIIILQAGTMALSLFKPDKKT